MFRRPHKHRTTGFGRLDEHKSTYGRHTEALSRAHRQCNEKMVGGTVGHSEGLGTDDDTSNAGV